MENENGWTEYRRLILDWHEEEKEFRTKTNETLDGINTKLNVLQNQHQVVKWVSGVVLPSTVALMATWLGHKFGIR
jgi:hypothetical protein